MRRRPRILTAAVGAAAIVALATGCDVTDDTRYEYAGSNGIKAYPDTQFFIDAGAPLIHLYLLCSANGTQRYVNSPEYNAAAIAPGAALVVYCPAGWARSTDWHVVGRQS